MYTLFFWIVIALFGLALYIYPSFWVRRMYEAYENVPSANLGAQTNPPMADFAGLVQKMQTMLEPQIHTPDLVSLPSPTASKPTIRASGAKAQPDGAVSTKSLPQTAEEANKPLKSGGLEQGVSFQNTKPSPAPACPPVPDMREYIRKDMIPEQAPCPPQVRCPDMRQYIRKDSIPCWACKLK